MILVVFLGGAGAAVGLDPVVEVMALLVATEDVDLCVVGDPHLRVEDEEHLEEGLQDGLVGAPHLEAKSRCHRKYRWLYLWQTTCAWCFCLNGSHNY